jgi:hypothetical protein
VRDSAFSMWHDPAKVEELADAQRLGGTDPFRRCLPSTIDAELNIGATNGPEVVPGHPPSIGPTAAACKRTRKAVRAPTDSTATHCGGIGGPA